MPIQYQVKKYKVKSFNPKKNYKREALKKEVNSKIEKTRIPKEFKDAFFKYLREIKPFCRKKSIGELCRMFDIATEFDYWKTKNVPRGTLKTKEENVPRGTIEETGHPKIILRKMGSRDKSCTVCGQFFDSLDSEFCDPCRRRYSYYFDGTNVPRGTN